MVPPIQTPKGPINTYIRQSLLFSVLLSTYCKSLDIVTTLVDIISVLYSTIKPLLHYAGNLLATWWQKMVAGDCHHIFTPIIFYWIKFVQCIFYIEDIVNKYLLTHLLPPVANGRQYVASKISASVNGALQNYISVCIPNTVYSLVKNIQFVSAQCVKEWN